MGNTAVTRRRLLGVSAGLGLTTAVAGCDLFDDRAVRQPPPDPLAPVRDEAVALAAAYDRATATSPALAGQLAPIAEAHRAHATELTRLIGDPAPSGSAAPVGSTGPSADPSPGDTKAARAALRSAEIAARRTATRACLAAPAERAALLGSVAAARAAHAEALR